MGKLHWDRLTKEERAYYMYLQMAPRYGTRSGYLPDDCCECPACGQPVLGSGWCSDCYHQWSELRARLAIDQANEVREQLKDMEDQVLQVDEDMGKEVQDDGEDKARAPVDETGA